jgi:hypothetical protein
MKAVNNPSLSQYFNTQRLKPPCGVRLKQSPKEEVFYTDKVLWGFALNEISIFLNTSIDVGFRDVRRII